MAKEIGDARTFIDTSFFYALLDRDDQYHSRAARAWTTLLTNEMPLLTTNYVVLESCALVQNRLGLKAVRSLAEDIFPVVELLWVQPDSHVGGLQSMLVANRRRLSLVDCVNFFLLRQEGIHRVFAFDRHFDEQGFEIVC